MRAEVAFFVKSLIAKFVKGLRYSALYLGYGYFQDSSSYLIPEASFPMKVQVVDWSA